MFSGGCNVYMSIGTGSYKDAVCSAELPRGWGGYPVQCPEFGNIINDARPWTFITS